MTTKPPLFSIVTITFNNLDGLRNTMRSVQAQTFRDYEWLAVDGASTDGTAGYLKAQSVLSVSEPDRGIYDAMNKGIERATGGYLIFMNAGDEFAAADTLERIRNAIGDTAPDLIYGDSLEEGPSPLIPLPTGEREGSEREGDGLASPSYKPALSHRRIRTGLFTHHQAILYRRETIGKLRYDISYKIAGDYKFTAQFIARSRDILYCPLPVCVFESGGISQRQTTLGRVEQARARAELGMAGPFRNRVIMLRQHTGLFLRRYAPALFRMLRH